MLFFDARRVDKTKSGRWGVYGGYSVGGFDLAPILPVETIVEMEAFHLRPPAGKSSNLPSERQIRVP
jgi:hypothetical protein